MNRLPTELFDEILCRMEPKSLALLQCTDKHLRSHISEYVYRVGSSLLYQSSYCLFLFRLSYVSDVPRSLKTQVKLQCRVLGSCSGFLLLLIGPELCVANPITRRCQFLYRGEMNLSSRMGQFREINYLVGFGVEKIDRSTQGFKIVLIRKFEVSETKRVMYEFETYLENSWILFGTSIPGCSSDIVERIRPVYVNGKFHCLLKDGGIIAFNPYTEKARRIRTRFHHVSQLFLGATENRLTLISATDEVISFYTLKNRNWVLESLIKNVLMEEKTKSLSWNVVAYDGKCLLLGIKKEGEDNVVHGYDMRDNRWRVVASTPRSVCLNQYLYHFTPSCFSFEKLENMSEEPMLALSSFFNS